VKTHKAKGVDESADREDDKLLEDLGDGIDDDEVMDMEEEDEGREECDAAFLERLDEELVDSINIPPLTRQQINLG
jgi:hypothetical protein